MVSRRVHTLLEQLRAQGIRDELVLDALAAVPREKFIDESKINLVDRYFFHCHTPYFHIVIHMAV